MQKLTITITDSGLKLDLQKLIIMAINNSKLIAERVFLDSLKAWATISLN
jgi:hypothetical protein